MKKVYLLTVIFLVQWNSFSQVGIGTTTPNASSSLDISSTSTGLLIPRVSLIDISNGTAPVSAPATSLLVYNTNAAVTGGNGAGYYFWNGSIWTKLFVAIDQNWTRNGSGQMYPTTLTDLIGIGTSNPSTNLHIDSNNSNPVIFDGGSSLYISFAENGLFRGYFGSYAGNAEDIEFGTYAGNLGAVHLTTNNTPKLTVINNGNVGIGTTQPNALLQFSNTVTNRKMVLYDTNNNDHQYYGLGINGATFRYQTDSTLADHVFFAGVNATTSNELMRVKGNGNVGIGINPAHRLDVVGSGGSSIDFRTSGRIWTNSTDGGIWLNNLQDAFMGNISTTQFGFWSSSVGWTAFNITKSNGFIGIGTATPTQKVDIIGKIKITDGTQGVGRVLSSDANGVGTWVNNTAITPAVIGVFPGGGANIGNGTPVGTQSAMTYCNVYIDLPVGKWIVFGTYLLAGTTSLAAGQSVFVRTTLSISNVVATNPDLISGALVSGTLAGPSDFGLANGQTIINNTSGATRRYYLWANVQKFGTTTTAFTMAGVGSNFWSENQLSAIPTN